MNDDLLWAYCIRCGAPLTNMTSQSSGFGMQCREDLSENEQSRLRARAMELRASEHEVRYGERLHWLDRIPMRLRLVPRH